MSSGYRRATPSSTGGEVEPLCPKCGSALHRIQRDIVDRLISLAWPIRRYRCDNFLCEWEGNLRHRPNSAPRLAPGVGKTANRES